MTKTSSHPYVDRGTDDTVSVCQWFASEPARRLLSLQTIPMSEEAIVTRVVGPEDEAIEDRHLMRQIERGRLVLLARADILRKHERGTRVYYSLTPQGRHTLDWAGAPKPVDTNDWGFGSWASDLAREIAKLYGVRVHAMLRTGTEYPVDLARARLCAALHARGWGTKRIETYFQMPKGWARDGIDLWRETPPHARGAPSGERWVDTEVTDDVDERRMVDWKQIAHLLPERGEDGVWR